MRNFVYAVICISLISYGSYSALKTSASGSDLNYGKKYPYQIIENKADRTVENHSGLSQSFQSQKIITDVGVKYFPEDKVEIFPDPELKIGATVKIDRAPVISIKDGRRSKEYRSWAKTVGELFSEKQIELGADDKVSLSLDAQIFNNSQIIITRVAITNVVDLKPIEFKTIEKEDPNLDYGKKRVDAGVKGEKKITYRVRREDGDEVERVLLSTEVVKEPKTQINFTGTKVTVLSSVRGKATIGPKNCNIVSANYKRGTLVRITNTANGAKMFGTVDCTWGTANAPAGVVLDVSNSVLSTLKWNGSGAGPNVLVEEIKQ